MAHLINISSDTLFDLTLHKIYEDNSWLGYNLKIQTKKNAKDEFKNFFTLNNDEKILFLGVEPEREIDILCNGIQLLAEENTNFFFFEPVDEKDFTLMIQRIKNNIFFSISTDEATLFNDSHWNYNSKLGVTMKISEESLREFNAQLWEEYQKILSQKS